MMTGPSLSEYARHAEAKRCLCRGKTLPSDFEGGYGRPMVPTLLHLHIPKCAGVSLKNFLAAQYAGRRFQTYPGEEAQPDENAMLISGHFPWGLHAQLNRPSVYFIILRDPVSRVASLFDFIRRNPSHPAHAIVNRPGMTIARMYREHLSPDSQFRDGMVRQVAGVSLTDIVGKRQYEVALVNLLTPNCVSGPLEYLPAALEALKQRLFIGPGLPDAATNASSERPSLSDEDIDAIRAANLHDLKLHAMVLAAARKVDMRRAREAAASAAPAAS